MNPGRSFILIIGCLLTGFLFPGSLNAEQADAPPFALIELFTSEGCSSCPPADALLVALTNEAREKNIRLFTLGFHVDYWNYLNWVDEYSDPAYSERQRRYAAQLKTANVYTPQMIVNGRYEFSGYRHDLAQKYIEQALARESRVVIDAKADISADQLEIKYSVNAIGKNHLLNVALVENNLQNSITGGENTGRTLRHANVVRAFTAIKLDDTSGQINFPVPPGLKHNDAVVILYVQQPSDFKIIGAQQVRL